MGLIAMPEPDRATLAGREAIVAGLRRILPAERVVVDERGLRPWETDGFTAYKQMPLAVVLPETTEEVSRILAFCHAQGTKVVPRGAGTSLSGGALPLADGVLMSMMRFNRILDIDFANRAVVTQPGVTNLGITRAVDLPWRFGLAHSHFLSRPFRSPPPQGGKRKAAPLASHLTAARCGPETVRRPVRRQSSRPAIRRSAS